MTKPEQCVEGGSVTSDVLLGVTVGDTVTLTSTHHSMNPILQQHKGDTGRVVLEGEGFNAKNVLVEFEGGYRPMHTFWINRKRLTPNAY